MQTRLTGKAILAAIHAGDEARAEEARALVAELRTKGKLTVDDVRRINMLDHQFMPFFELVMRLEPNNDAEQSPPEMQRIRAAFTAVSVSVTTAVICIMMAAAGQLL